jgi:hypothetical protein
MKKLLVLLGLVAAAFIIVPTADAQTVFNPTAAEITPSADYNLQLSDGSNVTTGIRLQYFLQGVNPLTGSPVMTVDICKPPLNTAGKVFVTVSACASGGLLFGTPLAVNTSYFATATQYGPGGESARSPVSNFFVLLNAPRPPVSIVLQ